MDVILHGQIPLAVKLAYSAFMLVLLPVYLRQYGVANFLYFCDTALLLTLAGIWQEDRLLLSIPTVGILMVQMLWLGDYFAGLCGRHITGLTDYMFDPRRSRFLRGLSLFHGWLPLLLMYLVWRTGYDPRALAWWSALAVGLILASYRLSDPPSPNRGIRPVNINCVYGLSDQTPQRWMPQWAWLLFQIVGGPILFYLPAHWLLLRLAPAS